MHAARHALYQTTCSFTLVSLVPTQWSWCSNRVEICQWQSQWNAGSHGGPEAPEQNVIVSHCNDMIFLHGDLFSRWGDLISCRCEILLYFLMAPRASVVSNLISRHPKQLRCCSFWNFFNTSYACKFLLLFVAASYCILQGCCDPSFYQPSCYFRYLDSHVFWIGETAELYGRKVWFTTQSLGSKLNRQLQLDIF